VGIREEVRAALVDRFAASDSLVEVGVGERPDVAGGLAARGKAVTATDVTERAVPDGVTFTVDDVTDPALDVYAGADVVYALNCPPELQRPLVDVGRTVDADAAFTTLGGDPVVVPAEPEQLDGVRATLYVATARGSTRR
jgi:uncharacterized UPF0146 family protein